MEELSLVVPYPTTHLRYWLLLLQSTSRRSHHLGLGCHYY